MHMFYNEETAPTLFEHHIDFMVMHQIQLHLKFI